MKDSWNQYRFPENAEMCEVCGTPLQEYGLQNGIVGWHLALAAYNSYLSGRCSKCCRVEKEVS